MSDTDVQLMVEKDIRCGIFYSIYWFAEASNKYMKDYDSNKQLSYSMNAYWDVNNLYGWAMSQKLPGDSSE